MVPGSTLMYGSSFCIVTRRPRDLSRRPRDAAVRPLPSDDATPPVTKMCFAKVGEPPLDPGWGPSAHVLPARPAAGPRDATLARPRDPPARAAGDRKSTRLNSSHVAISYAVFCLKKKK